MSKQKLITYLSALFLLFTVSGSQTTPASAGDLNVQNKLHLEPQMSWPVQWDKVKGQNGHFWVCGQNSGYVSVWDDKTMEKVAHIDDYETAQRTRQPWLWR